MISTIKKSTLELSLLFIVFLLTIYIWTLPVSTLPFGDVDSAPHFILADSMSYYDMASIYRPYPVTDFFNNPPKEIHYWYPPQFHTNLAIMQVLGNDRFIPPYILLAIVCFLIIMSIFLLINHLYGFIPAILSSLFVGASSRDYWVYLWGQWPQATSFFFVPLILYAYFKYVHTNEKKFLFLTSFLSVSQYIIHPQGILHSGVALIIFTIIFWIKQKKLSFDYKWVAICLFILIFLIFILAPLQFMGNLSRVDDVASISSSDSVNNSLSHRIIRLFQWNPPVNNSIPQDYFHYSLSYGLWTLPFLLMGIFLIFYRRNNSDILMISWLISIYILLHLDLLGSASRLHRSLGAEAHLFFPLIVLGIIFFISLFKVNSESNKIIYYVIIFIVVIVILSTSWVSAYNNLNSAYGGISRITKEEYDASKWVSENTPLKTNMKVVGTLVYAKKKWITYLAYKGPIYGPDIFDDDNPNNKLANYAYIDYSDAYSLGRKDVVNAIKEWELSHFNGKSPIYDKNNVKVYIVE